MLSQKPSIKNRDGEIGQPTAQRNMLNILKMMISTGKKFTAYHTRLCKVQYKLLHRYLATSDFLNKIGISSSPRCSLCDGADESLEHLFVSFLITQRFWAEMV